uniref:Potassium/proton antiporter CemA n=1 Tax=Floydiella terrestris TaxID=51328 RepID=E2DSM9_FLOTE|nr:chloroplast enveloppe membrane protein [Floydiella terrestris]ACZ58483.1 chloroplast enveloppe membrane protein [Floydiella terrestris]
MELERIGFIPRSILRMLDRFYNQLSVGTAEPLVKEFRFSKYLLLTSVKSLLILFFLPLLANFATKTYIFRPLIEDFWDRKQSEIFLNFNLQERAFYEMSRFEEKIYFESLVKPNEPFVNLRGTSSAMADDSIENEKKQSSSLLVKENEAQSIESKKEEHFSVSFVQNPSGAWANSPLSSFEGANQKKIDSLSIMEHRLQEKTIELAEHYNHESREAITNLLADFMGLGTLCFLLLNMKMSITNTTAFLFESFFSLKDSRKSFLMLLFTDLLVGFHSPRGWEVLFSGLFEHFGLPENENIILLLVGTFPVLLDALFKYWIFRHLNRHSPATVATYQSMVE